MNETKNVTEVEVTDPKVLQPMRFVDAIYNFTPVQEDFILLVQKQMTKSKNIRTNFTIDLKPYLEGKGLDLKNIRYSHYDKLSKELLESQVSFKFLKGDKLFVHYNLFKKASVDKDFILDIGIIEDVLPLFYINKLKEGHFKDSKLILELFEASFPEYDTYVAIPPNTFIEFEEAPVKKLYKKLLQYRKKKEHTFEFAKDEIYHIMGFGHIEDVEEENLLGIPKQVFVQDYYKGINGWKNLSKNFNKWLIKISEHKRSGLSVVPSGSKYYTTKGRPIRSSFVHVKYDKEMQELTLEQQKVFIELGKFGLSDKQRYNIMKDFELDQIIPSIREYVVKMKEPSTNETYYGEYKRSDYRKIENEPGYIYGVVFKYGTKKSSEKE